MRRIQRGIMAAAAASALGAGGAQGQDFRFGESASTPLVPGQFYFGAGATSGWYHRPDFANNTSLGFGTANRTTTSFDAGTHFVGPGGTVGFVLKDGTLPAWIGKRVRIAFSGGYVQGSAESDTSTTIVNGINSNPFYSTVDGRFGASVLLQAGFILIERVKVSYQAYELNLRVRADHALGPGWTLTPSFGVFGGRSLVRYHIEDRRIGPSGIEAGPHDLDARTSSTRFGFDGGATLTWQPRSYLSVFGGGRIGLLHIRSRMRASDCFNFFAIGSCGTPPGTFVLSSRFNTSIAETRSTLGVRAGAHLGVTLSSGWADFSLAGFFNYDSKVPGIVNQSASVPFVNPPGPTRLIFSGHVSYGAQAVIRIALP